MSQENVEIVQKAFAAMAAREPISEFLSRDIELIPYLANVDGKTYHGIEGVKAWQDEMSDAFEEVIPQLESARALDDHHVLALGHTILKGKESGAAINFEWAQLVRVENGLATSIRILRDEAEALEAVGLSE